MSASQPKRKRKRRTSDDDQDYVPVEEDNHSSSEMLIEESELPSKEGEASSSKQAKTPKSSFATFNRSEWSPQYLYRTVGDLTATAIRQSGSEGVGRLEIGKMYGMDTQVKAGNRKVSTYIMNVMKTFPDHFGQFQKMEGKYRSLRYYWKVASQPENFNKLFARWEELVGCPCPFKMGQVIKFPNTNLSTLRISDVSLRRLIDILNMVKENHIIVTMTRFLKMLTDAEKAHGYQYQIDKKSATKCLFALEKQNLLHLFDTVVVDESVSNKVQLVCAISVESASDPEVIRAIRVVIDEYHEKGRVFPNGQLKYVKKEEEDKEKDAEPWKDYSDELAHLEDELDDMTRAKRLSLLRLQVSRTASIAEPEASVESEIAGEKVVSTDSAIGGDESITPPKTAVNQKSGSAKTAQRMDEDVYYGRQSKWNRCAVIHKLAYHFVRGVCEREKPNFYERFPPGKYIPNVEGTSFEDCPVYVDEESPYRFVPPLPQFSDLPRGWFMLQDFLSVLPLSVYALVMRRKIKSKLVEDLLKDPVRRHTLVADLPRDIRLQLLNGKMAIRQLEHNLLVLCGLGLARLGSCPDVRKTTITNTQFYFITRSGMLRDTSTSQEGYANVTLPIEQYNAYNYTFSSLEDLDLYWHHLRAIALSTQLAYKLLAGSEDASRNKKYAVGTFDKTHVYKSFDDFGDHAVPVLPHDGCSGFDSAFFIHLRRHWDLSVRPPEFTDWFVAEWRRSLDRVRGLVESRVRQIESSWYSYLKSLIPTDAWVWKKNKVKDSVLRPAHGLRAMEAKNRKRKTALTKPKKTTISKKRPLDDLDIISVKSRKHFRSRFTNEERDMLILIRAVGFFLNPVYRFWLDPAVLRDIMHFYVKDSRTKTVQSLMAAGVREMVRPQRIGLLRQIVKNLSSFQEMRDLRTQLAAEPSGSSLEKREFFLKAFDAAKRNLAMESSNIPSVRAPDSVFNERLSQGIVKITTETLRSTPFPLRSQKPTDINQIRHCVAFNVVTAMLLSEKDLNDSRMDAIVEQVSACSLSSILEQLRIDGLLARLRVAPDEAGLSSRGQTVLSYYFRHFFNHRFHNDIVELTSEACKKLTSAHTFSVENNPGTIVAASVAFYGKASLDVTVPDNVISAFEQSSVEPPATDEKRFASASKQLRHLAKSDLRIEDMIIGSSATADDEPLTDIVLLLNSLNTAIPTKDFGAILFEDFLLKYAVSHRSVLRNVYAVAKEAGIVGVSVDEIVKAKGFGEEEVVWAVEEMKKSVQLIAVGIDCYRYVIPANSSCWLVHCETVVFFPTPWMGPSGEVYPPTLRWMSEGVLFLIIDKPGISMKDLKTRFAFALQPRMLVDIVDLLSKCGCVTVVRSKVPATRLFSPFAADVCLETVEYVTATVYSMERFSKIFDQVKLSSMLASFRSEVAGN